MKEDRKQNKSVSILIWFLCLMAYQSLWVIQCQIYSCTKIVVVISNPYLGKIREIHAFSKGIRSIVKVISRLQFELPYDNVAVQCICHKTTEVSIRNKKNQFITFGTLSAGYRICRMYLLRRDKTPSSKNRMACV